MWGCRQGRGGELKTEGRAGSPGLCSERRGSGQAHRCWTAGPQDAGSLSPTVGVTWSPAPEGGPRFPTLSAPRGRTQGGPVVWPWAPALLSCGGAVCALPTASPTGGPCRSLEPCWLPRGTGPGQLCVRERAGSAGPCPTLSMTFQGLLFCWGWGGGTMGALPGLCTSGCSLFPLLPFPCPPLLEVQDRLSSFGEPPQTPPVAPRDVPPPHPHDTIMLLTPSLSSVLHTFPLTAPSRI